MRLVSRLGYKYLVVTEEGDEGRMLKHCLRETGMKWVPELEGFLPAGEALRFQEEKAESRRQLELAYYCG